MKATSNKQTDQIGQVDRIDRALAVTGAVVRGVAADQWVLSTPCPEWDVRALVNHLVGGLRLFTAALTGMPAADHDSDWLGMDPVAAWTAAAAADAAAWRHPGALDGTLEISLGPVPGALGGVIHVTEIITHGVDLAVATGQEDLLDEELIDDLLATMRALGVDAFRVPGVFGPEVAMDPGRPVHLRLLAFLGRPISAPMAIATTALG